MNQWLINKQSQIGGNGLIVEIDETKFGRRKYNRGRLITGQWFFGDIKLQKRFLSYQFHVVKQKCYCRLFKNKLL